ncbi:50S ribosomal protein L11 methyltransferase [Chitinophagaceae bacterium LB-8]|uniref:Ribosomal protein L11 methyltransferase n=1 Tax=Paraflavisolibacter caeni TaxID=2982496 RepID=A0A9X3B989_9BACT|nr:50S ribosomal protein L11 methyltransferase [Paraflavisolibacter caeni]MCU7550836.1 50S ribosomal protein L11 methyltransferase [Paraflavisolibacter caeni]
MDSIKLSIKASQEAQELLIATLSDLNATGFEQQEDVLIAWFYADDFNEVEILPLLSSYEYDVETVKEQNWNEMWEKDFQPVIVEDFCAIRAHFHEPITTVQHEIIITPKMSFGTGHHATTYMMVQQMKDIDFRNKSVFDFGTGTGILAILAEKLGAREITAIDVDDWSIENAAENIARNQCQAIELYQSSSVPVTKTFDIILANINKNVILQHLASIIDAIGEEGKVLFSGLLIEDEQDIISACKGFPLSLLRKVSRGNWISLYFSKTS